MAHQDPGTSAQAWDEGLQAIEEFFPDWFDLDAASGDATVATVEESGDDVVMKDAAAFTEVRAQVPQITEGSGEGEGASAANDQQMTVADQEDDDVNAQSNADFVIMLNEFEADASGIHGNEPIADENEANELSAKAIDTNQIATDADKINVFGSHINEVEPEIVTDATEANYTKAIENHTSETYSTETRISENRENACHANATHTEETHTEETHTEETHANEIQANANEVHANEFYEISHTQNPQGSASKPEVRANHGMQSDDLTMNTALHGRVRTLLNAKDQADLDALFDRAVLDHDFVGNVSKSNTNNGAANDDSGEDARFELDDNVHQSLPKKQHVDQHQAVAEPLVATANAAQLSPPTVDRPHLMSQAQFERTYPNPIIAAGSPPKPLPQQSTTASTASSTSLLFETAKDLGYHDRAPSIYDNPVLFPPKPTYSLARDQRHRKPATLDFDIAAKALRDEMAAEELEDEIQVLTPIAFKGLKPDDNVPEALKRLVGVIKEKRARSPESSSDTLSGQGSPVKKKFKLSMPAKTHVEDAQATEDKNGVSEAADESDEHGEDDEQDADGETDDEDSAFPISTTAPASTRATSSKATSPPVTRMSDLSVAELDFSSSLSSVDNTVLQGGGKDEDADKSKQVPPTATNKQPAAKPLAKAAAAAKTRKQPAKAVEIPAKEAKKSAPAAKAKKATKSSPKLVAKLATAAAATPRPTKTAAKPTAATTKSTSADISGSAQLPKKTVRGNLLGKRERASLGISDASEPETKRAKKVVGGHLLGKREKAELGISESEPEPKCARKATRLSEATETAKTALGPSPRKTRGQTEKKKQVEDVKPETRRKAGKVTAK